MRQPFYLMRLLICCGLLAGNLHAEIATSPLTIQSWVPPNVVVTLDDSPSMEQECIPSSLCALENIKFDDEPLVAGSIMHYLRHDSLNNASNTKAIAAIPYGDNPVFGGVITYDTNNLLARQMRSAKTNPTYYDPAKRYFPWPTVNGVNFANADPTKAYYHPGDARITQPTGTNAKWIVSGGLTTFNLTAEQTTTLNFCTSASLANCSSSSQKFFPAQYYKLVPGRDGTKLSDFQQVIISNNSTFVPDSPRSDCNNRFKCTQAEELQNFANWYSYYMPADKNDGDRFIVFPFTYNANNLLAVQMRSSSSNSAYYNPQQRYRPWLKADLSYEVNANPAQARFNPNNPSYTIDLTKQITASTKFCTDVVWSKCPPTTETFYPAQYYVLRDGASGNSTSDYTQVVINTGSSFTKYPARTDCAGSTCTREEELQNFANWFSYYRTKWLAAKTGISQTFKIIPGEVRLGYGTISVPITGNSIDGELTGVLVRGVRPFSDAGRTDTARSDFYNWMLTLNTNTTGAGTPLRRAVIEVGNYYMRNDNAGPWAETPGGSSTAAHQVCRRALHLMVTDGGWGQPDSSQLTNVKTRPGDRSVATGSLLNLNVDGSDPRPFSDANANTLADVAMYYWKTNLRSDLSGKVTVPQSERDLGRDTNQPHMVNYLIGFGVDGTLNNPEDRAALIAGTKSWPAPTDEPTKVDDMWHAAWNSGGQAFNAIDPKQLSDSLSKVIESMKEQVGSDAPLVLPSRFASSNYLYIPSYKSKIWSGDLLAYTFDTATGDRKRDADGNYASPVWSAASQLNLKSADARRIYTFDGTQGLTFDYASLNSKGLLPTLTSNSAKAQDLINYLRGSAALESETGYRIRPNGKLGDIVNSPPLLVLDAEDAAYDFLAPSGTFTRGNYRQFLLDKKKRIGQVFAGANDGMLHAFNANTGEETFSFIPRTVLGAVYRLSDPNYVHHYYVDGPLVEADVYDNSVTPNSTDTGWRNIVVGTGGAGARNLFAIKVPVKSDGDRNTVYPPGERDILWEVNNTTPGLTDLGFVLQKPAVGMMRDGTWVVIVGNGYVNSGGTAKLYILNALTGAFIKSISVPSNGNSGLGGVRLVLDWQRQIIAAYAGDLEGNLWKFDFSSNGPTQWDVAFGGKPLFKAQYATPSAGSSSPNVQNQPITAAPVYLAHPLGGNLVVFGTGKLFELTDPNNNDVQTLYAVWDRVITGEASGASAATTYIDTPGGNAIVSMSSLVEQTVTSITNTSYYHASNNIIYYPGKRGWFIKLNMSPTGLRSIFPPQLAVGKVFLQTLSPSSDAQDACADRSSKTVNFVLNPFTGSATSPTFDVNGDGRIDAADGFDSSNNVINAIAVISDDARYATFSQKVGSGANTGAMTNATSQKTVAGAANALRRTWRQIINRPRPTTTTSASGT